MDTMETIVHQRDEARAEAARLLAAIKRHFDQHGDDRCWQDDGVLYAAAGLCGIASHKNREVGDKFEMLKSCVRYIELRCAGGDRPSYAEVDEHRTGIIRMINERQQKAAANCDLASQMVDLLLVDLQREIANQWRVIEDKRPRNEMLPQPTTPSGPEAR